MRSENNALKLNELKMSKCFKEAGHFGHVPYQSLCPNRWNIFLEWFITCVINMCICYTCGSCQMFCFVGPNMLATVRFFFRFFPFVISVFFFLLLIKIALTKNIKLLFK